MTRALPLYCLLAWFGLGCSPSLELVAHSLEESSDLFGFTPSREGNHLVAVEVTLTNRTDSSLPITPGLFSLEPVSGASVTGHGTTLLFSDGCQVTGNILSVDQSLTCTVAFEIGSAFVPMRVAYEFDGHRAVAPVPAVSRFDAGVPGVDAGPVLPTTTLDLLFMIDDSPGMSQEQGLLAAELPAMIAMLSSGDIDLDGDLDDPGDFTPVSSLNVGVISADMGTGGHTVPTCADSDFGDDGLFRTDGNVVIGCDASYPAVLSYSPPESSVEYARDIECVATLGTGGCAFEQQLESVLKSVTPAAPQPWTATDFVVIGTIGAADGLDRPFFSNTQPHGAGLNSGFMREGSVLTIVLLSDEDDCSAHDPQLFDPSGGTYVGTDLNLRCFVFGDEALHPVERYAAGLLQLRRSPMRVVYAPIVGVPRDLVPAPGLLPDWDRLVGDDTSVRDDRMEERIDPAMPRQLVGSCFGLGGVAYPPVRIVRVAQAIAARGGHVTVQSICEETGYASAIREIVARSRDAMAGTP
jgi:hypothetical protein